MASCPKNKALNFSGQRGTIKTERMSLSIRVYVMTIHILREGGEGRNEII